MLALIMYLRLKLIPKDMLLFHKMRWLRHESSVIPLALGTGPGIGTSIKVKIFSLEFNFKLTTSI